MTQPDTRPAIPLEVGKRYQCRNGIILPPMQKDERTADLLYCFHAANDTWCSTGQFNLCEPMHPLDIVEEYHEGTPAKVIDIIARQSDRIKELEGDLNEAERIAAIKWRMFTEKNKRIAVHEKEIERMQGELSKANDDILAKTNRIAALEQQVGEAKAEIQPQVVDALRDRITRLEHELAESIKDLDVALREKLLHDERSMKLDSDRVIDGWVVITPNNLSNSKYDSIKHAEERVMGLGKVALCYARVTMMCEAATVTKREPHWTYPSVPLKEKT